MKQILIEQLLLHQRKFPMLTFIDDDGRTELKQKWEPILKEKKIN